MYKIVEGWYPGMAIEAIRAVYGDKWQFHETGVCRPKEDCVINDMLFCKSDMYPVEEVGDGTVIVIGMCGATVLGFIYINDDFNKYFEKIEAA